MLRSLFLLAVLAVSGRAEDLIILKPHLTHGILGPHRTEKRFIPGDNLFVSFVLEGLKTDSNGKVRYSTTLDVIDGAGKVLFHQTGKPQEMLQTLGGDQVPAYAQLDIGLSQPPGEYTLKLIVTDLISGKSQSHSHKGVIEPKGFGVVRITTSADAAGAVPSGLLGPGQSMYVNALVVGFERDAATKQPNLTFELRVLDEAGKPTLPNPFKGTVDKEVAPTAVSVPMQFLVSLNRAGKFTVEIKATDKVTGKTDVRTFPITVHQP